jgi:NAD(P)-dependent dehydrogenase (short-subunit alcohol dehydrogenase family)
MTKRFTGRVVLITGAAGGLGRVSAVRFAQEGAHLVLTDINEAGLEDTAAEIRDQGATCSTHGLDLAVEADIKAFGAQICSRHPKLHALFNNAGIAYGEINGPLEMCSQEKWLRFLSINSLAPLFLAQALRPALANAQGAVINQSSMASYTPAVPYAVTKATLNAMTYGMAHAFGGDGIRVNAIAPGIMETPANKSGVSAETYARIQGMQMLKLHGTADDIAALAVFLASDDARFINCEIVSCDAGNRLRGWRG